MSEQPISFGTSGWRSEREAFTKQRVSAVGVSYREWLAANHDDGTVVVGYDTRPRSQTIAEHLAGVIGVEFDVKVAVRPTPTPVVGWYTSNNEAVIGGVVATASHNPPSDNGIKLLTERGFDLPASATTRIEERANNIAGQASNKTVQLGPRADLITPYVEHIVGQFDSALGSLTVVYDALHGAGSNVLPRILEELGATVHSVRNTPNVGLQGVTPHPRRASLEEVTDAIDNEADIAFISDCDADRLRVITPERAFSASSLLALLYDYLITENQGGPVVRTVSTGSLVDDIAAEHGHDVIETKVGFKHMATAAETHDAVIGGEQSDGFCHPNHLYNKDGLYTAVLVAQAAVNQPLESRIERLESAYGKRFTSASSVPREGRAEQELMDAVWDNLLDLTDGAVVRTDTTDGYKAYFDDNAWLLIRPSGTEPLIRVYSESSDPERAESLVDSVSTYLKNVRAQ